MNFSEFMHHLQNTETMVCDFEYSWDGDFVHDVGMYNAKHHCQICIIPENNEKYTLKMETNPFLEKRELRELLDLFNPYFLHSYSRSEFIHYLKDQNIIDL